MHASDNADRSCRRENYIAPKRSYGFDDMMADVLEFAFSMLVDNGRLCMWMPTANDEDIELAIPTHPGLILISVCVQAFNKCMFGGLCSKDATADTYQGREGS